MTTCRGKHDLIVVYSHGPDMEETVVRWCQLCGAITVDVDYDGRTQPGSVRVMQLPKLERLKQGVA